MQDVFWWFFRLFSRFLLGQEELEVWGVEFVGVFLGCLACSFFGGIKKEDYSEPNIFLFFRGHASLAV